MPWIRFLKAVEDRKVGDFLEVEESVARSYTSLGLAEDSPEGPEKELLRAAREEYFAELRNLARDTARTLGEAREGLRRPDVNRIDAGEQQADKTKGPGDFVRQVFLCENPHSDPEARAAALERLTKDYGCKRGLAEGQGATGGFTTPILYEQQMMEIAAEDQVLIPYAQNVPLGARDVEWPALDQYKIPAAGQSAFYGGVQVFRKGENVQRSYTQPAFSKVKLAATDVTAISTLSRDLIQDSTASLDAMVPRLLGGAIGWRVDWEAFNGTGSGMMLGIYNAPATINVSRNTGSTIKYQDIFTMFTRLTSEGKKRAKWYCHPYTIATLLQIQDPSGKFILLNYFGGEGALAGAPQYKMLGVPVIETEKAPTLGNVGDLLLADPFRYLNGTRAGLEIGLSEHFLFDTDQVAIRVKLRNDGQPQAKKALTLADGSSKVSPFVQLQ